MGSHAVARAVHQAIEAEPRKCDRVNCGDYAWWLVGVRVWARAQRNRVPGNAAEFRFPLAVCEPCKARLKVEDLVDDHGWARIVHSLKVRGAAKPARDSLQLTFRPLAVGGTA